MRSECVEGCETVTLGELSKRWNDPLPDHIDPSMSFEKHANDCPVWQRIKARGIELADQHGW